MKKLHYIIPIILIIFSFFSCTDFEEVLIHHDPYLNIYANISSASPELNFVHVFRTTGYGEPDRYELDSILYHEFYNPSSGDTIRYQTLYIDTVYAINDANVYYIHNNDTLHFYEAAQGFYKLVDTSVHIITGDSYELHVETEDFEPAYATEEALSPINWIFPENEEDTLWISISDPSDTLRWTDIGSAYDVNFEITYRYEWGSYSYNWENVQVRNPFWAYDSTEYDDLFNYDPFKNFLESDWNPDSLELAVTIVAYSESYLDYKSLEQMQLTTGFIRYPTINDFRVNITNSMGAFTSLSVSDKRTVMFTK